MGIPYTIHAGEAMGPESMREALALGTKRIGHGIRCQERQVWLKNWLKTRLLLNAAPAQT